MKWHLAGRLSLLLALALALPPSTVQAQASYDRAIAHWRKELAHGSVEERIAAARGLRLTGPEARAALPALLAALDDTEPVVRAEAASALARMGRARSRAAVPLALRLVRETDADAIDAMGATLRSLGPDAAWAADELTMALARAEVAEARRYAALALGRTGAPSPQVLAGLRAALLQDPERAVRREAATALAQLGSALGRNSEFLVDALSSEDAAVRQRAADLFGDVAKPPRGTDAILARLALADVDPDVRSAASKSFQGLHPADIDRATVDTLLAELASGTSEARRVAARLLGRAGPAGIREIVGLLMATATDPERGVRTTARGALASLARTYRDAVAGMAVALRTGPPVVRVAAANVLGRLGDRASPAGIALITALVQDADPAVRVAAADTLGRLRDSAHHSVSVLGDAIRRDPAPDVRAEAARALGELEALDADSREALLLAQRDRNQTVRNAAALALDRLERSVPKVEAPVTPP